LNLLTYKKFCTIGISVFLGRLKHLILNINNFNKKKNYRNSDYYLRYGTGDLNILPQWVPYNSPIGIIGDNVHVFLNLQNLC
jgi:hypothetical protein